MEGGLCDDAERPLPGCDDEPHYQVNGLQHWYRFYGAIEILGEEVPEDLGPEEAFDCGGYLVWRFRVSRVRMEAVWFVGKRTYRGREDDEARPVVLDEFAHGVLYVYSSHCSPEPATPDLREEFNRRNYSGSDSKYNGSKNKGESGVGERSERYPNQRT